MSRQPQLVPWCKLSAHLAIIFALLLSLISACAPSVAPMPTLTPVPNATVPAEKPKPAATAPAKDKPAAEKPAAPDQKPVSLQKLKLAYVAVSVNQAVPWVAKEKGLFEKYGLDVDLTYIASTPTATAALMAGEVQILVGAQEAVITSGLAGSDLIFIASGPTKLLQWLFGKAGVTKAADLKGGKVGATRIGTSSYFAAKYSLLQLGLEPGKDATILQIGGMPEILAALTAGGIDAGILSPPSSTTAKKQGMKIVYDLASASLPFQNSGIIVRKSWIPGHEETVRSLMKAYVEATAVSKQDKPFTLKVIEKYTKVTDPDELSDSYDDWIKITPVKPYPLAEALKTTLDDMDNEPKAKAADPNQFIDRRFVEELDKSGFIDSLFK